MKKICALLVPNLKLINFNYINHRLKYEKLYNKMEEHRIEIVYLVPIHSIKSKKFKSNPIYQHQNKKANIKINIGFLTKYIIKLIISITSYFRNVFC